MPIFDYDFNKRDIASFELELNDFIPRLRVTVEDNNGLFTINSYPKDGDCLICFNLAPPPVNTIPAISLFLPS